MYSQLTTNFNSKKQLVFKVVALLLLLITVKYYLENIDLKTRLNSLNSSPLSPSLTPFNIENVNQKLISNTENSLNELNKKVYLELSNTLNRLQDTSNLTRNLIELIDKFKGVNVNSSASKTTDSNTVSNVPAPNIVLFDLNKALEPASEYDPIQCRKSAVYYVSTTLCVHNLNQDVHVSGSIWREGVWEPHIVRPFTDYLNQHPDWLVLDVGAQIGEYSLFAAKMGRYVVCVEPFYENIIRIHKAAKQEKIEDKITLITNAVSNKRNEVKMLQPSHDNIGGQSLLTNKDKVFTRDNTTSKNKYLVETIFFDDIIPYLPKTKENKDYEKAILKIDIEGFEPYAFQNAKNLFDKLDIGIVFMEWGNLPQQTDNFNFIVEMIDFLLNRKLIPYGNNAILIKENWKNWPWDIVWKKNGL